MTKSNELYGVRWQSGEPLAIEMKCIQLGGSWTDKAGKKCGNGLAFHYTRMMRLIWPGEWWSRWDDLIIAELTRSNRIFLGVAGPSSCVAGDTRILDPITGLKPTIRELHEQGIAPTVMTVNGPAKATVPFIKGFETLYLVKLDNGDEFRATANHLVLTPSSYVPVSTLKIGQCLLGYASGHLESTSEFVQSVRDEGDPSCVGTIQDSQSGYRHASRFCDAPLHAFQGICQDASPSQADVQTHKVSPASCLDDPRNKPRRNRSYQHFYHHAMQRNGHPENPSGRLSFFRAVLRRILRAFGWCGWLKRYASRCIRSQSFGTQDPCFSGRPSPNIDLAYSEYPLVQRSVQAITKVEPEIFYDLCVPDYHHYFAEGAIHHNSGKTHRVSRFALCLYFCFPNQTTVLCSTTTRDMLEMRIWGEIKKGFRIARERFSWLPGIFIESKQMLITDEKTEDGREFRCGIKGVACKRGGQWEGLGDYVGIKNDIVMLAADEAHLMEPGFFDASGNLASNERFILAAMANPKDTTDAFGSICEPLAGWDTHDQGDKTQVWDTRFRNGRCLRLVGTDSPNLDRADGLVMFPKLIGQRYISEIENTYGRESWQFLMWVMAKFPISALERRVITRAMCIKFHAFELPQFGNTITKLFAMDAAYSAVGGDRCIGMELAFGRCTDGISRVALVGKPMLIPVSQEKGLPEDQIAKWVMEYCTQKDIPPRQVFFDGTGRSSLMYAFGRLWSPEVVPLEFGGMATDRPAPADPRKTCRDLYGKFVTELWYVTRTLIESDQCRGMTDELCQEGCLRAWTLSKNGKADVEPKDETKLRLGRSPDIFDSFVAGCEGARRLGFTIGKQAVRDETGRSELLKLRQQWSDVLKSRQLTNA